MLVRLQSTDDQTADGENNSRNQIEPHEQRDDVLLFGSEARRDPHADDWIGKDRGNQRHCARDHER